VYDEKATCPTWNKFLEQILPDIEVRTFIQRAIGYALTGSVAEQLIFFFHGTGANGKSTFTDIVLAMLGDYGQQAAPDLLMATKDMHPTAVADLLGARFVVSSEIEQGRRLNEALVKQLTGGDAIKARFMRMDFFQFTPTHKLFLHANHRPVIKGTDHAIWRRMRLVPFTVTIPDDQQDKHLVDRLRRELPGILKWAIRGCLDWQRDGLTRPAAVMQATSDYRADMDLLGAFIDEMCVIGDEMRASANDLFRSYSNWCDANGEHAGTQKAFGLALGERGYTKHPHGTDRRIHWFGIGLLEAKP
jgi:putative DNA primase/helicase